MGRQKYPRRKHPKKTRAKLVSEKAHESEPERTGAEQDQETEIRENLAWDSLDELNLAPTPSGTEYLPSPDEMEVTRKLSCLNFSVLPCPAGSMIFEPVLSLPDDHNYCGVHTKHEVMVTDLDLSSVVGTDLLPTLSDRDMSVDVMHNEMRYSRKRPSRRKPNKRVKKSRSSITGRENTTTHTNQKHFGRSLSPPPSLCVSFVRPMAKDPQFSRTRSFRKPRCLKSRTVDDPLLCFLSDTSAVCDIEVPSHDKMDDTFDCTPPGEQCVSGVSVVDKCGGGADNDNVESDLSETTTSDSGCEGDDEESSVEGPLLKQDHKLSGWWEKDSLKSSSSDDEKFSQILNGAFPLMSDSGRKEFTDHLCPAISEFKHPGQFGVSMRRGRKKRCKPPQLSNSPTLMEVSQQIVKFVTNGFENELRFNLVSRALCRTISCLANVYNLDCYIEQKRRLPVASPLLRKSLLTRLASHNEIEPILRNHGRESPSVLFRDNLLATRRARMDTSGSYSHSPHATRPHPLESMMPRPPNVVGSGIPPLNESNVGNQMLQNMGWIPGMGLGLHGDGMREPVRAEVRPKKTGLGY